MKQKTPLAYEKSSDSAYFRENYRFIFSVAVIATVFIVPTDNALYLFLKAVLGFSAAFAALYLIATAALVKYNEPSRMYVIFYVSERFRMSMFDWSIDFFGAAFLYFIGLMITGAIEIIFEVKLGTVWSWAVLIGAIVAVIATLLVFERHVSPKIAKKQNLPRI